MMPFLNQQNMENGLALFILNSLGFAWVKWKKGQRQEKSLSVDTWVKKTSVIFPFSSLQCSSLENIAHTVMRNAVNVTKIFNEIIMFSMQLHDTYVNSILWKLMRNKLSKFLCKIPEIEHEAFNQEPLVPKIISMTKKVHMFAVHPTTPVRIG